MNERQAVLWLLLLPVLTAMLEDAFAPRATYQGDGGDEAPGYRPPAPDWMPEETDPERTLSYEEIRRLQFHRWLRERDTAPS